MDGSIFGNLYQPASNGVLGVPPGWTGAGPNPAWGNGGQLSLPAGGGLASLLPNLNMTGQGAPGGNSGFTGFTPPGGPNPTWGQFGGMPASPVLTAGGNGFQLPNFNATGQGNASAPAGNDQWTQIINMLMGKLGAGQGSLFGGNAGGGGLSLPSSIFGSNAGIYSR
jgi:hypothetical protein